MPIESAEYISQFDLSQPNGAIDTVDMLDDFLRGIKKAVQQSFPNVDKQVLMSSDDFNNLKNHFVRGSEQWDMKNSYVTNVRAIDQDNAVEPRSYNDGRYLIKSNNLSDVPNKQVALNELLTGFNSGSPAYQQMRRLVADICFPVGSIYANYVHGSNPSDFFGIGVWERIEGRVLVGSGTTTDSQGVSRTISLGELGGEFSHSITVPELPSHSHSSGSIVTTSAGAGRAINPNPGGEHGLATTGSSGNNVPMNVMQPYVGVYLWKRTG